MSNLICKTRGRSYNRFPRNTKQKFLASCVQADRDAQRIAAEVEDAYAEYAPGQVFHSEQMFASGGCGIRFRAMDYVELRS